MVDLKQKELNDWQLKNFGGGAVGDMALGMVEEMGELCHNILKKKQRIREYDRRLHSPLEAIDARYKEQVADAFGDMVIFGIQLLTREGIDAEKALRDTIELVLKRTFSG